MKKIIQFLLSSLFLAGCALSGQDAITPTSIAYTLTNTVTVTSTRFTPTFTVTPTPAGQRVVHSDQTTPNPTVTAIILKPRTPTPGLASFGFNNIFISNTELFLGKCTPNEITFKVWTSNTAQTRIVEVYVRLKARNHPGYNDWDALTLNKVGTGVYEYTYQTELFSYQDLLTKSWLQYQVVSFDRYIREIARSPIVEDRITVDRCPVP